MGEGKDGERQMRRLKTISPGEEEQKRRQLPQWPDGRPCLFSVCLSAKWSGKAVVHTVVFSPKLCDPGSKIHMYKNINAQGGGCVSDSIATEERKKETAGQIS